MRARSAFFIFFFFNDTATTEIYTLSLHDALPISSLEDKRAEGEACYYTAHDDMAECVFDGVPSTDRKSTRLNSSHSQISYAVFCLKKKKQDQYHPLPAPDHWYHLVRVCDGEARCQ